ncbi:glycosyltransferase [Thermomonas paludicola]|uniref:glycosyltransferase n=1 Tax=Thermomonas paludicola TaxID=2884874 RepID=UPI002115BB8E|nr:glycosyltransferase [Thermomonas paludicola]
MNARPRICLVTYNWPPRNAIGTQRAYAWAKYWAQAGAEVVVLTAAKQAYDAPLTLVLPELPGVRVVEVGPKAALAKPTMHGAILRAMKRVRDFGSRHLGVVLDVRDRWVRDAQQVLPSLLEQVDVVASTHGPRGAHMIAARMKAAKPSLHWIADYRDLWSENHLFALGVAARHRERVLECKTMQAADAFTTVSDELADALRRMHGRRVEVVPNGFDPDVLDTIRPLVNDKPVLVYTGRLYRDTRDPRPLFQALAELSGEGRLQPGALRVDFYGPRDPWLEDAISQFGVDKWVRICGHVTWQEALSAQAGASMLLLLEGANAEAAGMLTGKLFEYLALQRPILSIGSAGDSAIARVLRETGCGIAVGGSVDLMKQQLQLLLAGNDHDWFRPNDAAVSRFSRKLQALQVLAMIKERVANVR